MRRLSLRVAVLALLVISMSGCALDADRVEARRIALGAYVEGFEYHPARLDRYARKVGRRPLIVLSYKQWGRRLIARSELRSVWRRGGVTMITWEPWTLSGQGVSLRAIARGRFDRYLRRSARAAANWRRPVFIRFAHEMNGNWYPWGSRSARRYKRAWRHVVRIFNRRGARNVRWVWTPYVNQGGNIPFRRYYPGGRWVDWVGLDGFNWGYSGSWFSFGEIFGESYRVLRRISRRPVMIGETGSAESGSRRKARWTRRAMRRTIPRLRAIKAFVWFDEPTNGVDLRINSSRSNLRAYRRAARTRRYRTSRKRLLRASRVSRMDPLEALTPDW